MKLQGQCNGCGRCCTVDNKFVHFGIGEREETLEFLKARGYRVKQIADYMVQAEYDNPCPHLTPENKCDIYETRPKICREFPKVQDAEMAVQIGFEPNKLLPDGCGFSFLE